MGILETITPQFVAVAILVLLPTLYWGFNFVVIYHLFRFGVGVQPKRFAALYFLGSSFLFFICVLLFINMDTLSFKNEFGEFIKNAGFFTIY
jgi:hypothetical protein